MQMHRVVNHRCWGLSLAQRSPGSTGTQSRKSCLLTPRGADAHRPPIDYESHATGLDRNELGALLVAAGLGTAAKHALISLLALNGVPGVGGD